jgi:DNA-nicking Smr family endonuclease
MFQRNLVPVAISPAATTTAAVAAATTTTAAAAITAASAATTTAVAATAITTATAEAASTATAAAGTRARFIHGQSAAVERSAIHFRDRTFRHLVVRQLNEGKTARLTRFTVTNDIHGLDRSEALECGAQRIVRGVIREISDIQILHGIASSW